MAITLIGTDTVNTMIVLLSKQNNFVLMNVLKYTAVFMVFLKMKLVSAMQCDTKWKEPTISRWLEFLQVVINKAW